MLAIFRAVTLDVGITAPTPFLSFCHPLKKRTSSSNFRTSWSFNRKRIIILPAFWSPCEQQISCRLLSASCDKNKSVCAEYH